MSSKSDEQTNRSIEIRKDKDSGLILFDMDGVLVDVSSSYRKAIQETVEYFSKKKVKPDEIQELKEKGGFNNDWDLTEALLRKRNVDILKKEIINKFQDLYWGKKGADGYINTEKLLISKATLISLHKDYILGIVTGRPRREAQFILNKYDIEKYFQVLVSMEDYPPEKSKPHPYPIKIALERVGRKEAVYIGDSVDDILAAKRAGVRAVGCLPPGIQSNKLKRLLVENGAEEIIEKIDDIRTLQL